MDNTNLIVLRALLQRSHWYALEPLINIETFKSSEYRDLYKIIESMHVNGGGDISPEVLAAEVESMFRNNADKKQSLLDMIVLIDETPLTAEGQLLPMVRRFIQRSMSYSIAEYVTNNVEQTSFDPNVVADLAARAVDVSGKVDTTIVDIFAERLSGDVNVRPVRVGLGFSPKLDASLCGGIGPGELGFYLAGTAVGKSSILCKSGASFVAAGGTVLHITLEINARKVIERYDQSWTGKKISYLETAPGQALAFTTRQIVKSKGGTVKIVDWSYMKPTANDVGALFRKLQAQGITPGLIIIDYLKLMSPNKGDGRREYRHGFTAVGEEARALARNLDVPILTAWQANREGMKKDLIGLDDTSESHDICTIADIVVSLNANKLMQDHCRMKVQILKQRESPDRSLFELYCDMDSLTVRDIQQKDHVDEIRSILETKAGGDDTAAVRGDVSAEAADAAD